MPRGKGRGWQCLGHPVICIACFVQKLGNCAILCRPPKEDTAVPPGEAGGRGWRPGPATSGTAGLPVSTSMSTSGRTPRLALSTSSATSGRVHVQRSAATHHGGGGNDRTGTQLPPGLSGAARPVPSPLALSRYPVAEPCKACAPACVRMLHP